MGFAEQLAAKAAQRHRDASSVSSSTSNTTAKSKKRRPRLVPVIDEEYRSKLDNGGDVVSDSIVDKSKESEMKIEKGPITNEPSTKETEQTIDFAQQLKQRAQQTHENDGKQKFKHDLEQVASIPASGRDSSVVVPSLEREPMSSHSVGITTADSEHLSSVAAPSAPVVVTADHLEMQSVWNKQLQSIQTSTASAAKSSITSATQHSAVVSAPVTNEHSSSSSAAAAATKNHLEMQSVWNKQLQSLQTIDNNERARQHNLLKKSGELKTTTSPVFGAWAQIESLQQRLREAEERADRESRRAELAQKFREEHGLGFAVDDGVEMEEGYVGDLTLEEMNDKVYNAKESGESLETVGLVSDENSLAMPPLVQRQSILAQTISSQSIHNRQSDNEELLQWKQRAIQAEQRLSNQDNTALVSPQGSASASTLFHPPTNHNHPQHPPAVESDLIQLKNHEIQVLRHQISRLEHQIQQLSVRPSESYHPHDAPPIAVAECASSNTNASSHTNNANVPNIQEFQLLRNEIRNLQYQLSQKHNNRSTQSTTGSTLSSLENEGEDEEECEEEEEEEVRKGSYWGLCCVRRSRRGYGRVSR